MTVRTIWKRVLLLAVVVGLVGGAFWLDDDLECWARESTSASARKLAGSIAHYGKGTYILPAGIAVGLAAWWTRRNHLFRIVMAMVIAACLAGMAANVVRWTTGRSRPRAEVTPGWYGMWHDSKWIAGESQYSAFPSAHTATMAGFMGVLWCACRGWGVLGLLPGLVMAWARMVNRAHHLSDVTVGFLLGLGAAYWTWRHLMPCISRFLAEKVERKL